MIIDKFKLDGKVALVTGAGQGLGQGMALALAEAGADVAGLDLGPSEQTGTAVRARGRRYKDVLCNLRSTNVDVLNQVVTGIVAELGRLDILVNNAGIIRRAPAIEFSETDWDDVMAINLKAAFFLSQAAARAMVKQGGGKIINIASMLSFQGGVIVPSYTASKSGVAGITRALANEWAAKGVQVNGIAPGYVITDNTEALQKDPVRYPAILSRIPAGRWATPDDFKGAVVYLASPASDYVSGHMLVVDGGWMGR